MENNMEILEKIGLVEIYSIGEDRAIRIAKDYWMIGLSPYVLEPSYKYMFVDKRMSADLEEKRNKLAPTTNPKNTTKFYL